MSRRSCFILWTAVVTILSVCDAGAGGLTPPDPKTLTPIIESSPTLAPFQHVRFCLRYPADCRSGSEQANRVELNTQTMQLLDRVNRDVNLSITPRVKNYGRDLEDSWTIAPDTGDCNDYAVTKRHDLLESGLPSSALRLSVIKTASGVGHLVLVVATTNGDVVMDNLTASILPWQITDYQWLKIQSANDPRFWNEIKSPGFAPSLSQVGRKLRVAGR
jgi:predicted transglutaminase-like cysteine proteinase